MGELSFLRILFEKTQKREKERTEKRERKDSDHYTANSSDMALSPGDPNSYSRPDLVTTKHLHLDLFVDFQQKVLRGSAVLTLERKDPAATSVLLDANKLQVSSVVDEATGGALDFTVDSPSINGEKLEVKLPSPGVDGTQFKIRVNYSTTSGTTALEWLSPEQTADKQGPFLFS